jgi:hypothetical protein
VPDDPDDDTGQALVKVAPVPRLVLAKDLAAATPRSFVHIDRHGQVRSPARFRAIEAASYGLLAAITLSVTITYGMAFGAPGLIFGAAIALLFGRAIRRARRLQAAARLIINDRVEEAEVILGDLLRSRRLPRRLRALAEQNLAACHLRRGRFDEALVHQRLAIGHHARWGRHSPFARIVQYGELLTLVNLGRVAEARALFGQRHPTVPDGDYLRVHHWIAELYVCFAEGGHAIDQDELHARARTALGITSAAALLALLAWAHHVAGDVDQAWHLLRESVDRRDGMPIERTMPRLHAWIEAHREAAALADDPYATATS